jgi:hypothetical protein
VSLVRSGCCEKSGQGVLCQGWRLYGRSGVDEAEGVMFVITLFEAAIRDGRIYLGSAI